jgi:hypothetical protein
MKKLSKEELDNILDPKKIAEFINKDGQLNTEEQYESSSIAFYLSLQTWEENEGLLLLCGIEPQGAKVDYGYENSVGAWIDQAKIHHAEFIGRPDIYKIPSQDELTGWLKECNEEYQANHQDLINPSGSSSQIQGRYPAVKKQDALYQEFGMYENLLSNKYFNQVWEMRANFEIRLSRYRKMWNSGRHEDRNPPGYYIDWVLNQGQEIPWLEWVKSEGLLPGDHSNPRSKDDKAEGGTCDIYPPIGGGKKNTGLEWRGPSRQLSIEFAENSSGTKNAIAKKVLAKLQEINWKGRGGKEISIEGVLKYGIDESLTFESL